MELIQETGLQKYLKPVAHGKVRELFELDDLHLLFVATDRISAFDVIMKNTVDEKGAILTNLSEFWFKYLQLKIPSLRTHFVSLGLPSIEQRIPPHEATRLQLQRRSMVVKRVTVFPIESIVRGYITGSAWSSYQIDGTVCGIQLPIGLQESEKLERPLWTPSTKAELGDKDENISPAKAAEIVGKEYADQIETLSLHIYKTASEYAAHRGIIIADTKFEFGLDESITPPAVVLIDEVLTPDSSRFWSAGEHVVGRCQRSFDKQYLRDWLMRNGLKGKEGVDMPYEVVLNTSNRYKEAYQSLTQRPWFADS